MSLLAPGVVKRFEKRTRRPGIRIADEFHERFLVENCESQRLAAIAGQSIEHYTSVFMHPGMKLGRLFKLADLEQEPLGE